MKILYSFFAADRQTWRAWLEQNYAKEKRVWLIYFKTETGKPCISYDESVEEALCFGWIDSLIQKIDEEKYARLFTPRTNTAKWSDLNKRRVAKMIREGRMTPAGLEKIEDLSDFREDLPAVKPKEFSLPPEVETVMRANPQAWENFNHLPNSQKKRYMGWVLSARRPETIQKRLEEIIGLLEQNKPLGLK